MWARVPGPMRFDADPSAGIRLQLSTSDQFTGETPLRPFHNHRSSSRAANDSDSDLAVMQLQSLQGIQQQQQQQQLMRSGAQRMPISSQEMASMLDKVTVLLSQNPHTFSFLDSSETEDGGYTAPGAAATSDGATSHGSRPGFRVRAAFCHGHTTVRRAGSGAGTTRSQSAVEPRSQQMYQLPMQQLESQQSNHQPKPHHHHQHYQHQQHQQLAGDAKSGADAKSTASTRTRYFFDSMFLRNLQFSCARVEVKFTPNETSLPYAEPPLTDVARISEQPSVLCLIFNCTSSNSPRPACVRLRNLRAQESAPADVGCQTDSTEPPVLVPLMLPPKPLPPARSKSRCRSTKTSRRSRRERRPPHAGDSFEVPEEDESNEEGHQRMRSFRPDGCDGAGDNGRGSSSVLRSVGRHLNSFFCPGTCGRSENPSGAPQAIVLTLEPPDWQTVDLESLSRYRPEIGRRVIVPTGAAHRASATAHSRRVERTEVLTAELPSRNTSLSSKSCDWETPPLKDKRRQRKRRSPPSPESTSHGITESWGPGGGSGFDSLVRTLDRARQRMGASTRTTGATSPGSYRSHITSFQRQPPPAAPPPPPQQPQQPAREHCRFHTCEVACEVCNLAEERDEEEIGNWPGGNQSNAGCSETCNSGLDNEQEDEDDACLVASVELMAGESTIASSEECSCQQYSKHQMLIGSLERCLSTLSQDMHAFLNRVNSTTAELQRLRDLN